MSWTEWMVLGPALLYAAGSVGYGCRGEWGFCLAYAAYAVANIGLVWAAVAGR